MDPRGLMGKKLGMIQVYNESRQLVPVTVIEAGPCGISAIKTVVRDGYDAVQLGFHVVVERKLNKPELGHLRSSQGRLWKYLREFRGSVSGQLGDIVTVGIFGKGEYINVSGVSKGKGFQGVMKRHNYAGGPASHGSMFHRAPGSIGNSSYPSRVWKNKAMPGHMGSGQVTVKGLQVVDVRPDENLLLVRGAVPGPIGGMLVIRKSSGK
ncbi:MAG: 50S ribosomal protein L3 [Nitrospirales bacterium]|nr:50S ribosomal protein L3 [Nitrospirales bacterium]